MKPVECHQPQDGHWCPLWRWEADGEPREAPAASGLEQRRRWYNSWVTGGWEWLWELWRMGPEFKVLLMPWECCEISEMKAVTGCLERRNHCTGRKWRTSGEAAGWQETLLRCLNGKQQLWNRVWPAKELPQDKDQDRALEISHFKGLEMSPCSAGTHLCSWECCDSPGASRAQGRPPCPRLCPHHSRGHWEPAVWSKPRQTGDSQALSHLSSQVSWATPK